jgi:hypothetical protein
MKEREFEVIIKLKTKSKAEAIEKIKKAFNTTSIKCLEKRRTTQQNRALHLFFTLLATELNQSGYDMKKLFREEIDIPWNSYNIKNFLWRPMQKAITGKRSSTQLSRQDIDRIYEPLMKTIGERTGIYVPWPDIKNLMQ